MKRPLAVLVLLALAAAARAGERPGPVKVVVLAGQSNMEGKAKVSLLEYQAKQPATRDLFKHLLKDGRWGERDDVWIKYLGHRGNLTVGYGNPKCIGPELEIGLTVGDHYREQVLLIKTAWGGRSLYRDFRPPSAGLPPAEVLEKTLAELKKRKPDATMEDVKRPFGASYRAMLDDLRTTLADLKAHFPAYAGQGHELAGFVWFQGWNDMISPAATAEYAANLGHFIRDVRRDLKAPKLPFVVGQMGVGGVNPDAGVKRFRAAQAAGATAPEFKGNVALARTDVFWDAEAEAVFKKGWRENLEEWNKVGSDYPYHYLGSPKTMCGIGKEFAAAMLGLRGERTAPPDQPARVPFGFTRVFNGRDLTDWEGSPKYWKVEDGPLTGTADGTLKYNRFLTWRGGKLKNFILQVEVKVSPGGNSGIQYRGTERPDLGESVVTGYQCDVVAGRADYDGMLYEERGRRILAHSGEKVVIDPKGQPWVVGEFPLREFKAGQWHEYRVVAEGNRLRHWIDGFPTVDVTDLDEKGRKLEGVLAVQVHVGPAMKIQYRDFFLKRLPDDLPILTADQARVPAGARQVVPQGKDKPRKPDAK